MHQALAADHPEPANDIADTSETNASKVSESNDGSESSQTESPAGAWLSQLKKEAEVKAQMGAAPARHSVDHADEDEFRRLLQQDCDFLMDDQDLLEVAETTASLKAAATPRN